MRLDQWLFKNGWAKSRTHAEDMIKRGDVKIFDQNKNLWIAPQKPSYQVEQLDAAHVKVESELTYFVSRGGLKLNKALAHLNLDVSGKKVLDVGQSTGGFTDCVLQAGAAQVIGVEVGKGQLAEALANHPLNMTFENLDIRLAHQNPMLMAQTPFDLAVIDASFISLHHILTSVIELVKPGGLILALVKPQFELTSKDLDKRGIVRSLEKHDVVKTSITDYVNTLSQVNIQDYFQCEEKGKDGNVEFFIFLQKNH